MRGRFGRSPERRTTSSEADDRARPGTAAGGPRPPEAWDARASRAAYLYFGVSSCRAMAAFPGLQFLAEAGVIIGIVLALVGIALAFWGHSLWATVMSIIGALLGSSVGYLFGAAFGGGSYITGLILAAVGAMIGSILFTRLVKVALAFLVGLLAGVLVYALLGGTAVFVAGQMDTPLIGALLVLVVVFALAYYYIDDLIGIITAAIGGLLLAAGLFLLGIATLLAGGAGLGAFVLGAVVQTSKIRRKREARARAAAAAAVPPPPPTPPPPR